MLDAMRLVGDPPADALVEAIFAGGQIKAVQSFMAHRMTNDAPTPSSLPTGLRDFVKETATEPLPDASRIESAQSLFVDHGPEILTTLGCYALPDALLHATGSKSFIKRPTSPTARIGAYSERCRWWSM